MCLGQRGRSRGGRRRGEAIVVGPHDLEGGQQIAQALLEEMQQRNNLVEVIGCDQRRPHTPRLGKEPEHSTRHNAQGALAADEELFQIVTGVVLEHFVQAGQHAAVGQHDLQSQHQGTHDPVAQHPHTAGIHGDAAAHRGRTARRQVQGEKQSSNGCSFLHLLQGRAGLDGHSVLGGVDLLHRRHPFQGQDQIAGRRLGRRHQVGAPAVGDDGLACSVAERAAPSPPPPWCAGARSQRPGAGTGSIQLVARAVTSAPVRTASGPRRDCSWASRSDISSRDQKPATKTQRHEGTQRKSSTLPIALCVPSCLCVFVVGFSHPRKECTEPSDPFRQLIFPIKRKTQPQIVLQCALAGETCAGPIADFVGGGLRQVRPCVDRLRQAHPEEIAACRQGIGDPVTKLLLQGAIQSLAARLEDGAHLIQVLVLPALFQRHPHQARSERVQPAPRIEQAAVHQPLKVDWRGLHPPQAQTLAPGSWKRSPERKPFHSPQSWPTAAAVR